MRRAVRRIADPLRDPLRDAQPVQPRRDHLARQEVVLHEPAKAAADAVLAARDDRGVRDRNPERVPEQRCDREPVRETADHRRLGRRANEPEPRELSLEHERDDENHGRADEQTRRPPLHAVELDLLVRVFLVDRDPRRRRRPALRSRRQPTPSAAADRARQVGEVGVSPWC